MEKQYKRGDVRKDGKVFYGYHKSARNGEYWMSPEKFEDKVLFELLRHRKARTTKEGHAKNIFNARKSWALKNGIPFSVTIEYMLSLLTDSCPVLNIPLNWGNGGIGKLASNSPSIDKIKPELGYVEGNVMWMSHKANAMKQNATPEELKTFANWILANA